MKIISISLSEAEAEQLAALAKALGVKKSEAVRALLRKFSTAILSD